MAAFGIIVSSQIKDLLVESTKISPWWDDLKMYCTYGIVTLGMVAFGTSQALGAHMACTPCGEIQACSLEDVNQTEHAAYYVNYHCSFKYSAENYWTTFIFYSPIVLIAMALLTLLADKGIKIICRTEESMACLHRMLEHANKGQDKTETIVELLQSFVTNFSSSFYLSYAFRALFEWIYAFGMLGFIVYCGLIHDQTNDWLCSIGNSEFFCDNHKVEIYRAFLIFAAILLAIQGMCAFGSLIWLVTPCVGKLGDIMKNLELTLNDMKGDEVDNEHTFDMEECYYSNKNFKFMFDLLSKTNGVEACFQIFCLLDKNVNQLCKVDNINIAQSGRNIKVKFDGAPAFKLMDKENCMHTVEIYPKVSSGSTKVLKGNVQVEETDAESGIQLRKAHDLEAVFKGLDSDQEYTLKIQSIINGRPVTSKERTKVKIDTRKVSMMSSASFRTTLV